MGVFRFKYVVNSNFKFISCDDNVYFSAPKFCRNMQDIMVFMIKNPIKEGPKRNASVLLPAPYRTLTLVVCLNASMI